ncbi:AAA domain-containing protein [Algoriphagus aquaeductus]|uniref:AAA domain-containing protein n=1 Tax=Algoriphagus aquaeductus TaxID=475299 RepID=A0A326RNM8_9BACT|nr:AAA family ATPase [Algoriphagus aquaeductus]PZV77550.1 AAA domain-containing protein [Algoriphagus aquaeductus]
MSRIRIKNFGPIKEGIKDNDGWIDIKKVTVFIGNQGSGKSTVAKLISTFTWIEKALTRGDYDKRHFERKNKLKNQYLKYHRIENYFSNHENQNRTLIEYFGDSFNIAYENGNLYIEDAKNGYYPLPQIMYVPAERNFIANVKKAKALSLTSDSLIEFVSEYNNALNSMKGSIKLPISKVQVEYNRLNDIVYLKGDDYKIKLTESSSGYQSLVPLYLVSTYLGNSVKNQSENDKELMTSEQRERFRKQVQAIFINDDLTEEQKRIAISEEAKKFNKTAFINIVEEPEQNLFPSSQKEMLFSLLAVNNMNKGNKLIMTTHSPYLINYLTLAVKAGNLFEKSVTSEEKSNFKMALSKVVPIDSVVNHNDLAIYELNEEDGTIILLDSYRGLPSDENYLNQGLAESNELFAQLLDLQQAL